MGCRRHSLHTIKRVVLAALSLGGGAPGARAAATAPASAPTGKDGPHWLPPLVVSGTKEQFAHYVRLPGLEVLSSCSRIVTGDFAESCYRALAAVHAVIPAEFLLHASTPEVVILVDEHQNRLVAQVAEQLIAAEAMRVSPPREERADVPRVIRSFLPNLSLWDGDSRMTFTIVREREFDASRLAIADDQLRFLLEGSTPALPRWFAEGMLQFLSNCAVEPTGLATRGLVWISCQSIVTLRPVRSRLPICPRHICRDSRARGAPRPTNTIAPQAGPRSRTRPLSVLRLRRPQH